MYPNITPDQSQADFIHDFIIVTQQANRDHIYGL